LIIPKTTLNTLKLRSLLVFLLVLSSYNLFSQEDYEDVVYLKNGSIIHGMIIEQIPNVSIKIQTNDRNVFSYKIEEVEKITKELKPSDEKQKISQKQYPKKGITVQANLVYLGATAEVSYLLFPISIGVGSGINSFSDEGIAYIPIYLNIKLFFVNRRITPFIGFDFGYFQSDPSGLHINPNAGSKIMITNHLALSFNIGVIWHGSKYYNSYINSEDFSFSIQPDLRLGLSYRFGK
jgi:hypothetical protein